MKRGEKILKRIIGHTKSVGKDIFCQYFTTNEQAIEKKKKKKIRKRIGLITFLLNSLNI